MLLNQEKKVLFIANPKTATTAIQDWMQREDHAYKKSHHIINGKRVSLSEHITAVEACNILGVDYFNSLEVICVIRNPVTKITSAYNFYRGHGKLHDWTSKNQRQLLKRILHICKFLFATCVPFRIWAILYPYKPNKIYFVNKQEELIVGNIVVYENLVADLQLISDKLKLGLDSQSLSVSNVSRNASKVKMSNWLLILLMYLKPKFRDDIRFYKEVMK